MTVVCQVVNFPEKRADIDRIKGGPCLSALFEHQLGRNVRIIYTRASC